MGGVTQLRAHPAALTQPAPAELSGAPKLKMSLLSLRGCDLRTFNSPFNSKQCESVTVTLRATNPWLCHPGWGLSAGGGCWEEGRSSPPIPLCITSTRLPHRPQAHSFICRWPRAHAPSSPPPRPCGPHLAEPSLCHPQINRAKPRFPRGGGRNMGMGAACPNRVMGTKKTKIQLVAGAPPAALGGLSPGAATLKP